MNSCMEIFFFGGGGGGSIPNIQEKTDAFAPKVLELAGQYISLLVIQKFSYIIRKFR